MFRVILKLRFGYIEQTFTTYAQARMHQIVMAKEFKGELVKNVLEYRKDVSTGKSLQIYS